MAQIAEGVEEVSGVRVCVRVRPEQMVDDLRQDDTIQILDDRVLVFDPNRCESPTFPGKLRRATAPLSFRKQAKNLRFIFNRVFGILSTNPEVYRDSTLPMLDLFLKGFNCSVFAYGATGAGKTHTMLGTSSNPGVIFLSMMELFRRVDLLQSTANKSCQVNVSYIEIYNEQVRDLLAAGAAPLADPPNGSVALSSATPVANRTRRDTVSSRVATTTPRNRTTTARQNGQQQPQQQVQQARAGPVFLELLEDSVKGVVVQNLSYHEPSGPDELMEMLERGNRNRTQHPTDANHESSRSHAVFQVYLRVRDKNPSSLSQSTSLSKLSLIDLAGSERATVTANRGARMREGANINRSLLALGNCINSLAGGRKGAFVPYRDSKLTRLLKDSLGGNCCTVMIANIRASRIAYEDTYNTLQYAERAKAIRVEVHSNVVSAETHISQYVTVIETLKRQVADLQKQLQTAMAAPPPAVPAASSERSIAIPQGKDQSTARATIPAALWNRFIDCKKHLRGVCYESERQWINDNGFEEFTSIFSLHRSYQRFQRSALLGGEQSSRALKKYTKERTDYLRKTRRRTNTFSPPQDSNRMELDKLEADTRSLLQVRNSPPPQGTAPGTINDLLYQLWLKEKETAEKDVLIRKLGSQVSFLQELCKGRLSNELHQLDRLIVAVFTMLKSSLDETAPTSSPPEGSSATESLLEKVQQILEDERGVRWLDEQTVAPLARVTSNSREPHSAANPIAGWLLESPDNEQFDERLGQLSPAQVLASLPAPPPCLALTGVPVRGKKQPRQSILGGEWPTQSSSSNSNSSTANPEELATYNRLLNSREAGHPSRSSEKSNSDSPASATRQRSRSRSRVALSHRVATLTTDASAASSVSQPAPVAQAKTPSVSSSYLMGAALDTVGEEDSVCMDHQSDEEHTPDSATASPMAKRLCTASRDSLELLHDGRVHRTLNLENNSDSEPTSEATSRRTAECTSSSSSSSTHSNSKSTTADPLSRKRHTLPTGHAAARSQSASSSSSSSSSTKPGGAHGANILGGSAPGTSKQSSSSSSSSARVALKEKAAGQAKASTRPATSSACTPRASNKSSAGRAPPAQPSQVQIVMYDDDGKTIPVDAALSALSQQPAIQRGQPAAQPLSRL